MTANTPTVPVVIRNADSIAPRDLYRCKAEKDSSVAGFGGQTPDPKVTNRGKQ